MNKFKVMILNEDYEGNYWTELVASYDNYEDASVHAYSIYGYVEDTEVEDVINYEFTTS